MNVWPVSIMWLNCARDVWATADWSTDEEVAAKLFGAVCMRNLEAQENNRALAAIFKELGVLLVLTRGKNNGGGRRARMKSASHMSMLRRSDESRLLQR
ncbi:hypothetical protein Q8W43_20455 [Klebsiella pneumoniae]|nr:hypothetical protein Q8W43_20455 [Klebsiella pneumoniae]